MPYSVLAQDDDCLIDPAPQLARIHEIADTHPGAVIDSTEQEVTFTLLSGTRVTVSHGSCEQFGTSVQLEGKLLPRDATEKDLFAIIVDVVNEYWELSAAHDLQRALTARAFDYEDNGHTATYLIKNDNYTAMYAQYEYGKKKAKGRLVIVYYFG